MLFEQMERLTCQFLHGLLQLSASCSAWVRSCWCKTKAAACSNKRMQLGRKLVQEVRSAARGMGAERPTVRSAETAGVPAPPHYVGRQAIGKPGQLGAGELVR
jgi:hypothetical protein